MTEKTENRTSNRTLNFTITPFPKGFRDIPKTKFNPEKEWYVRVRGINSETGMPDEVRLKKGVNRIKGLEERKTHLAAMLVETKADVKNGYDPILNKWDYDTNSENAHLNKTLVEAINFALDENKPPAVSQATYKAYKSVAKYFCEAAVRCNLNNMPIRDVRRRHIKTIFKEYQKHEQISNKRYNTQMGYISALFGECLEYEMLEFNPCFRITKQRAGKGKGYIQPTDKELKIIKEYLIANHFNYYSFYSMLYHTGARPNELLALQLRSIDLELGVIEIIPDIEADNLKNIEEVRVIPINNFLRVLLEKMEIDKYPSDYYLFGAPREGVYKTQSIENFFKPSPYKTYRDIASEFWRKTFKVKFEMKCDLYAIKHKSADDKLLAGMSIEAIRDLFGHSSVFTTKWYITKLHEVNAKEILEKSGDL